MDGSFIDGQNSSLHLQMRVFYPLSQKWGM